MLNSRNKSVTFKIKDLQGKQKTFQSKQKCCEDKTAILQSKKICYSEDNNDTVEIKMLQ